jgi:hypothetical protein
MPDAPPAPMSGPVPRGHLLALNRSVRPPWRPRTRTQGPPGRPRRRPVPRPLLAGPRPPGPGPPAPTRAPPGLHRRPAGPLDRVKPPSCPSNRWTWSGPERLARPRRIRQGRDFASRRDRAIILLLVQSGRRRAGWVGRTLDDVDLGPAAHDPFRCLPGGAGSGPGRGAGGDASLIGSGTPVGPAGWPRVATRMR